LNHTNVEFNGSWEFKLSKAELVLRKKAATLTHTKGSVDTFNYGPNVHVAHRDCEECMRNKPCGSKAVRNFSAGIQATLDRARALLRISNRNL
jgi:hypothetical protein